MVNIADPLADRAHDLEDALNAGFLSIKTINKLDNPLVQRVFQKCRTKYAGFEEGGTIIQARLLVRP